ncbi:hypothetical protein [Kitasatospora aureofaciens]|uniref:hypothetical protein n=1 Tax=Kitasatospora aureofaciens TaxID=1894 RepID=UPI001C490D0C|nr:hypothetical protein [Kitasatospora aureofaciens]MBV6702381.1 hypothetical protein [Kitasatospora aureofaciens]
MPIPLGGPGEVLVALRGGSEVFAAWCSVPVGRDVRVVVVDAISARSVIVELLPS